MPILEKLTCQPNVESAKESKNVCFVVVSVVALVICGLPKTQDSKPGPLLPGSKGCLGYMD